MQKVILLLTILIFNLPLFSQENITLIDQLELELFPLEENDLYLYKVIGCEGQRMDSTILIREKQPDVDASLVLLEKILIRNEGDDFFLLLDLYNKHINVFLKEWGDLYKDNFYACDVVNEQFRILRGFEVVLLSLDIKRNKLRGEQIFDDCISLILLGEKFIKNIEKRNEIIKEFKVFSPSFRDLNSKSWFAGNVPFSYLDPYLDEVKPYFINLLYKCDWQNNLDEDCSIIKQAIGVYLAIDDPAIKDYFMSNYDKWSDHFKVGFIFKYAGLYHYSDLTEMLTLSLVNDPKLKRNEVDPRYYFLGLLLLHDKNKKIVKEILMSHVEPQLTKGNNSPLEFLKFFPQDDVVSFLIELMAKQTDEKIKLIEGILQKLSIREELSNNSREAIRRKIKN